MLFTNEADFSKILPMKLSQNKILIKKIYLLSNINELYYHEDDYFCIINFRSMTLFLCILINNKDVSSFYL